MNTEPGTYRPLVARGRSGDAVVVEQAVERVLATFAGSATPEALNVGVEASTRTSPLRGSSITTAPRLRPSASTAASWSSQDERRPQVLRVGRVDLELADEVAQRVRRDDAAQLGVPGRLEAGLAELARVSSR